MHTKISTMLLVAAFLICFSGCIILGYMVIDNSITRSYKDSSYESSLGLKRAVDLLENEWKDLPESELLKKLESVRKKLTNEKVVLFKDEESNTIVFDTLEFELEDNKIKKITYLN